MPASAAPRGVHFTAADSDAQGGWRNHMGRGSGGGWGGGGVEGTFETVAGSVATKAVAGGRGGEDRRRRRRMGVMTKGREWAKKAFVRSRGSSGEAQCPRLNASRSAFSPLQSPGAAF